MSVMKDRIRPLDPSSLQKFLGLEAEGEGDSPEPLAMPPSTPRSEDDVEGVHTKG